MIEDFRVDGIECLAEVHKEDPYIHPLRVCKKVMQSVAQSGVDCIIHQPGWLVNFRRSSKGPMMSFGWLNTSLSKDFMTTHIRVIGLWSFNPVNLRWIIWANNHFHFQCGKSDR